MEITIKTNHTPRELLMWHELTDAERATLDYVNPEERGTDFFRYRGEVYDMCEFSTTRTLPTDHPLKRWDGFQSDSYFSAVVIRHPFDPTCGRNGSFDYERVIVGLMLS
jgi:hypothetical protein